MSDFYKSIDCLVMPSLNETFGLVALEALSYCKTCLVSNTTGFSELIDDESGFIFNRNSFCDFVKKLRLVCKKFYQNDDVYQNIRQKGYELSLKYSWEYFVSNLLCE